MFESINAGRRIRWFILIRVLLVLLRKPRSTLVWFWGHNSFHSWVLADGGMCAANWFTKWWDTWIFPLPLEIVNSLSLRWIIGCVVWTRECPNPTRGWDKHRAQSFCSQTNLTSHLRATFWPAATNQQHSTGQLIANCRNILFGVIIHFNPAHHLSYYLIRPKANIPAQFIGRILEQWRYLLRIRMCWSVYQGRARY